MSAAQREKLVPSGPKSRSGDKFLWLGHPWSCNVKRCSAIFLLCGVKIGIKL